MKLEFDFLDISESRMLKTQSLNTNVSLQNYSIEQNPQRNKLQEGLNINKKCSYKIRLDLVIYKPKKT